jgi:hypothetical protein
MSHDGVPDGVHSADAAESSCRPSRLSKLGDDWYLLSSQSLESKKVTVEEKSGTGIWKGSRKLMVAGALGAILIGAAARVVLMGNPGQRASTRVVQTVSPLSSSTPVNEPAVPPGQTSRSKAGSVTNEDELTRLRRENRRLVALVEVLRQRHRTSQRGPAAEQSRDPKQ